MSNIIYVCKTCAKLSVGLPTGQISFDKHKLELDPKDKDDAKVIAAMDKELSKNPNLNSLVRKVDKAALEAELKATLANQAPAAIKGGTTAADIQAMKNVQQLENRDVTLQAQGVDGDALAKQTEELKSGDFAVTTSGKKG